jgi:hypothetical protein
MVLTTRNHTLLCGAFEAVSVGTPLITSDWPVLRNHFPLGTVHVANTVDGIGEGVVFAQYEQIALQRDVLRLHEQLETEWEERFAELQRLVASRVAKGHAAPETGTPGITDAGYVPEAGLATEGQVASSGDAADSERTPGMDDQ